MRKQGWNILFRNITSNSLAGQEARLFPSRGAGIQLYTQVLYSEVGSRGATFEPDLTPSVYRGNFHCTRLGPEGWRHLSLPVSPASERLTGEADAALLIIFMPPSVSGKPHPLGLPRFPCVNEKSRGLLISKAPPKGCSRGSCAGLEAERAKS